MLVSMPQSMTHFDLKFISARLHKRPQISDSLGNEQNVGSSEGTSVREINHLMKTTNLLASVCTLLRSFSIGSFVLLISIWFTAGALRPYFHMGWRTPSCVR